MVRRFVCLLSVVAVMLAGCGQIPAVDPGSTSSGNPPSGTPNGGGVVGSGGPTNPPAPSEVPDDALLTGADVGAGYTVELDVIGDDHGSIGMLLSFCGVAYGEAFNHAITSRQASVGRSQEEFVLVTVISFQPGWAQRYIDDLADAVAGCSSVDIGGDPNDAATLAINAGHFVGEGSLLIQEDRNSRGTQFHAVVRQGDLATYLRIHTGGDEDNARLIARAAADRLCAAHPC